MCRAIGYPNWKEPLAGTLDRNTQSAVGIGLSPSILETRMQHFVVGRSHLQPIQVDIALPFHLFRED